MRRSKQQIADPAQLEEILRRAQFCRIAMCDGDRPYLVAVCLGYESGKLYFHCAKEGRKIDVLRANPRVCFQVDIDAEIAISGNACQCSARYRSVVGFGTATIVEDLDEMRHGLGVLMRQYTDAPQSYSDKSLARTAVVRIDVEEMTGKQSPAPKE